MKQTIVTAFILNIIVVRGLVTFSTNSDDVTTILALHKDENGNDLKPMDEKNPLFKKFHVHDTNVYFDDIIFALKDQDWAKEEETCLNRTLLWLKNLQNFTLWAVWNWDSLSSEPQGVFYGSRYQLGNFDECMNPPWYKDHPEMRSQYCLADIVIHGTDRQVKDGPNPYDPYQSAFNWFQYKTFYRRTFDMFTWGVCVPDVCHPRSVERFMKVMLAHSHLGAVGMSANISVNEVCQKPDHARPFDAQFYAFVGIAVFLIALNLVSTYLNHDTRHLDKKTLREEFIGAFDLISNAKSLLKHRDQGLDILYGIKFITMFEIVISHQYCILTGGAVSNGLNVDEAAGGYLGNIFLHADLTVDTFFFLSGFLLATSVAKLKKMPNLFQIIFIRYVRLIIVYAVVIFYVAAIFPFTGSGPLWNRALQETVYCRKNWWLNMLMISNYVDSENICLIASWYIPCEFHFFLISLLLLWVYRKFVWPGRIMFVIVIIAAMVTPGVVTYVNELPPTEIFTYDLLINIRAGKPFQLTYIKSHTRYAANLVGIVSGFIYIYCSSSERIKSIQQKWSIAGAIFGLSTMALILFSGPIYLWRDYSNLESAAYAALNRPVFACGLAMFLIFCSLGNIPLLKGFLSWYPFVPLSRLSYGVYLTHAILIIRNVYAARSPDYYNLLNIAIIVFGITCYCLGCAFIIWLLAEAPTYNLLKYTFKERTKVMQEENKTEGAFTNNVQPRSYILNNVEIHYLQKT